MDRKKKEIKVKDKTKDKSYNGGFHILGWILLFILWISKNSR